MDILLVRPRPHPDTINLQSFMICEPLELEYAAAYLEQDGHHVDIVDLILEKQPLHHFIRQKHYTLVGFTGYLPHVGVIKELALVVKKHNPDIYTVVGGVQAEVMPADFDDAHIDFILQVNGLKTLKTIVNAIAKDNVNKHEIPGIWTGAPQNIRPETTFNYPFPNRNKTRKYRKHYNYIYHDQCATLKTSFGCPYRCEFCFCPQITQNQFFTRDIVEVIAEIKTIEENNIFIVDDNFLCNLPRLETFCQLLQQENVHKNFILFGRADFIVKNPQIITQLKDVGLTAVFIGLESFKETDLQNFNKKVTVQTNNQAVRILENAGIYCYSGLIAGLDFNDQDFDHLIEYLNTFRYPAINFQPITPIPGTPLFQKMADQICIPRTQYELWDMAHLVVRPTQISTRRFYYNIMRVYFCTSASLKAHKHILNRYGWKIYLRTLKGALCITWQYIKLLINPRIH